MNSRMMDYQARRLIEYCLTKKQEQGVDTPRVTNRGIAADLNMTTTAIQEIMDHIETIGIAYFRKGSRGSHNGTTVVFCDSKLRTFIADGEKDKKDPAAIDEIVYDRVTELGKTGKQFVLLAGDLKQDRIGPTELCKSLERMSIAGLITCRPLIIDEKWLVKICAGELEPTPKEEPIDRSKCPKCGTALPGGAKYCYMCGERMPKTEMEQLKDAFQEVVARVARMYNNSDRANKDLTIMQKVGALAFKEAV